MKGTIDAWHLQNIIAKNLEELAFFEDFSISHVRRSRNIEVDNLSKWALTFGVNGELRTEDFRQKNLEDFCDCIGG